MLRTIPGMLALLITLLLVACGPHQGPVDDLPVRPPSEAGTSYYVKAKQQYAQIRLHDYRGKQLDEALETTFTLLDGAVVNDRDCPLFRGKRGELCLELGPEGYERAAGELGQALEACSQWVPAHIALADLYTRTGKPEDALKHLEQAQHALAWLQETAQGTPKSRPIGVLEILGLNVIDQESPAEVGARSRDAQIARLLIAWLQDSEQWTIENPALAEMADGKYRMTAATQDRLFDRLRARIEFQYVMLETLRSPPPMAIVDMLDRVLRFDPDYFPARLEKAVQLRNAGFCREAERILVPYTESSLPSMRNHAGLTYQLALTYLHWCELEPKVEEVFRHAEDYFERLHTLNSEHAEGWMARARFYLLSAQVHKRSESIQSARNCLQNARILGYENGAETDRLQSEIAEAAKAIGLGAKQP